MKNSIDEETIDKGYNGVFQLFGADYVKIMFSGFQNSFQTLTKEEQVLMFNFMGIVLNTPSIDPRLTSFVNSADDLKR